MAGIRTVAQALSLVRRERVVTLTPVGDLPSLTFAIVQERISGSWWAHPLGKVIFNLASALDDHEEVLAAKLVQGKVTFVDRALFAPLLRGVTDEGFREDRRRNLSPTAKSLLARVEDASDLRLDQVRTSDRRALAKARVVLEERLLVHGAQEHTDSGAHQTRLRTWSRWATPALMREAKRLRYQDAYATLRDACRGEAFDDR